MSENRKQILHIKRGVYILTNGYGQNDLLSTAAICSDFQCCVEKAWGDPCTAEQER